MEKNHDNESVLGIGIAIAVFSWRNPKMKSPIHQRKQTMANGKKMKEMEKMENSVRKKQLKMDGHNAYTQRERERESIYNCNAINWPG